MVVRAEHQRVLDELAEARAEAAAKGESLKGMVCKEELAAAQEEVRRLQQARVARGEVLRGEARGQRQGTLPLPLVSDRLARRRGPRVDGVLRG